MVVATYPPTYLPWPGLFGKALSADCVVILDRIQFPRGRGWVNRNRLKSRQGEFWLTVPIHKKGLGLQSIHEVRIFDDRAWRTKHLRSIRLHYADAPYLNDHLPWLTESILRPSPSLLTLNLELLDHLWREVGVGSPLILQSQLGAEGKGTDLLARVCETLGATQLLTFRMAGKYLDRQALHQRGIQVLSIPARIPLYPQLWGEFVPNLSVVDLLLNCGPKSRDILLRTYPVAGEPDTDSSDPSPDT